MELGLPPVLLLAGTVLIFCSSCLAASTGSSNPEGPLELSPHCALVEKFKPCWVNHFDLPSCGNEKSTTVSCGELVGRSMTKCEQDPILAYAGTLIRGFRASDKALCDNRDMYEAFKNNGYCWNAARSCTRKILFSKNYAYDCSVVADEHTECLEDTPQECLKHVKKYNKLILQSHPCSGAALVPPTALLILLSVISLLTRIEV